MADKTEWVFGYGSLMQEKEYEQYTKGKPTVIAVLSGWKRKYNVMTAKWGSDDYPGLAAGLEEGPSSCIGLALQVDKDALDAIRKRELGSQNPNTKGLYVEIDNVISKKRMKILVNGQPIQGKCYMYVPNTNYNYKTSNPKYKDLTYTKLNSLTLSQRAAIIADASKHPRDKDHNNFFNYLVANEKALSERLQKDGKEDMLETGQFVENDELFTMIPEVKKLMALESRPVAPNVTSHTNPEAKQEHRPPVASPPPVPEKGMTPPDTAHPAETPDDVPAVSQIDVDNTDYERVLLSDKEKGGYYLLNQYMQTGDERLLQQIIDGGARIPERTSAKTVKATVKEEIRAIAAIRKDIEEWLKDENIQNMNKNELIRWHQKNTPNVAKRLKNDLEKLHNNVSNSQIKADLQKEIDYLKELLQVWRGSKENTYTLPKIEGWFGNNTPIKTHEELLNHFLDSISLIEKHTPPSAVPHS
jgi:cation transport regulator ChaC